MSRDFPLKGLKELDAFLSALPMNMQKGAIRAGLVAAAKPIRDEARLHAPRKTGKLASSIRTGSPRQNEDGTFSISLSVSDFRAIFQEYGVARHLISAGDSKLNVRTLNKRVKNYGSEERPNGLLKILGGEYTRTVHTKEGDRVDVLTINKTFVSGAVMHPGYPARPFLRPALETQAGAATKAFADRIRAYIEGKTGFAPQMDEAT